MPCAQDKIMYAKIQQSANILISTPKSALVFVSNKAAGERKLFSLKLIRFREVVGRKTNKSLLQGQSFSMFTMIVAVRKT